MGIAVRDVITTFLKASAEVVFIVAILLAALTSLLAGMGIIAFLFATAVILGLPAIRWNMSGGLKTNWVLGWWRLFVISPAGNIRGGKRIYPTLRRTTNPSTKEWRH